MSAPVLNTLDITLDYEALDAAATMLGSGAITYLDEGTCMVEVAYIISRFFNHESCGKCTPCREGTWWSTKMLERIENGEGRRQDLEILTDVCNSMSAPGPLYRPKGQCFCALGDGAAWQVRAILNTYRDEFLAHIDEQVCPFKRSRRPGFEGAA